LYRIVSYKLNTPKSKYLDKYLLRKYPGWLKVKTFLLLALGFYVIPTLVLLTLLERKVFYELLSVRTRGLAVAEEPCVSGTLHWRLGMNYLYSWTNAPPFEKYSRLQSTV